MRPTRFIEIFEVCDFHNVCFAASDERREERND